MTTTVPVPAVRARTGQPCVAPEVADALTGLALLVLPLLAFVAYLGSDNRVSLTLLGPAALLLYAATCVITVRGFLSDVSPWRVSSRLIPLRVLDAGLVYGFLLAMGAVFVALPDAPAANAAVEGRVAEFESRTSSAASSASKAGETAPAVTPVPEPGAWDNFLSTGTQQMIGLILLGLALLAFGFLVYFYVRARAAQIRKYPRVGPFDVPDHEF